MSPDHMKIVETKPSKKAFPFGDDRSVDQAFPNAISAVAADPFLMCDDFSMQSRGAYNDPDWFPVDWHPHKGIDILTYLKSGVGRHADSLGNRVSFDTPGMQWMSTGSGVVHAEGGATPRGQTHSGFQIWVNVPAKDKLKPPRYGTAKPEEIPQFDIGVNAQARVLAGEYPTTSNETAKGPFKTTQPVLIMDVELRDQAVVSLEIEDLYDSCMVYLYKGSGVIQQDRFEAKQVVRFGASAKNSRKITAITQANECLHFLIFAGKKLLEPIFWHGPIVMNTREEVISTMNDIQQRTFPPVKVPWNYKRSSEFPAEKL